MAGDSDEEPVCKYPTITQACKSSCTTQWTNYQDCAQRIKGKKEGDCEAWYFDYYKCIDKCRVPQIFKTLK